MRTALCLLALVATSGRADVTYPPSATISSDEQVYVWKTDHRVQINCSSNITITDKNVQFLHDEVVVIAGGRRQLKGIGSNTVQLDISNISISDSGKFYCVATSDQGASTKSNTIEIKVKAPPQSKHINVTLLKGSSPTLRCSESNFTVLLVTWTGPSGHRIKNLRRFHVSGDTLQIKRLRYSDHGVYKCLRYDGRAGKAYTEFDVKVGGPPESPKLEKVKGTKRGACDSVAWTSPFDGNFPILKYQLNCTADADPLRPYLSSEFPASSEIANNLPYLDQNYSCCLTAVNFYGSSPCGISQGLSCLPAEDTHPTSSSTKSEPRVNNMNTTIRSGEERHISPQLLPTSTTLEKEKIQLIILASTCAFIVVCIFLCILCCRRKVTAYCVKPCDQRIRQPKRTLRESIELLSQQQERNHEDVIQKVTMLLDNMKTLETGQTLPIQQLEEAIRSLQNSMTNDHNNRVLIELMDTLEHLLGTPV